MLLHRDQVYLSTRLTFVLIIRQSISHPEDADQKFGIHRKQRQASAEHTLPIKQPSAAPQIAPSLNKEPIKVSHENIKLKLPLEIHEEVLTNMAKNDFSEGKEPLKVENPDGSFSTRENLSDGSFLDRQYDTRGQLTGEALKLSSGDELARSFYKDGNVRGFSFVKTDGSITSATFLQAGYPKARMDKLSDGTEISTEYDDRGQPLERWKRSKDGQSEKM